MDAGHCLTCPLPVWAVQVGRVWRLFGLANDMMSDQGRVWRPRRILRLCGQFPISSLVAVQGEYGAGCKSRGVREGVRRCRLRSFSPECRL
ncbi:hypothetical protein HaLaN_09987 [Haematococcus lacustris]|uniref:Uncharacterized protein n=1 Tax=Haematococcus lacustris TaxID=44745 RepID=A0A699Z517_HAELA|nr:hypothetical protein HaLaN_09987 [Haematococcus lacustris]